MMNSRQLNLSKVPQDVLKKLIKHDTDNNENKYVPGCTPELPLGLVCLEVLGLFAGYPYVTGNTL